MKILMIGNVQATIVEPLVRVIKRGAIHADVSFSALDLFSVANSSKDLQKNSGFKQFPHSPEVKLFKPIKLWLKQGSGKIKNLKSLILTRLELVEVLIARSAWRSLFSEYDVIHLQSLFWSSKCEAVRRYARGRPVVLSIWGSDLLRDSNIQGFKKKQDLLEKVDSITVSGVELREILLAKFGRHLKSKIVYSFFSMDDHVADLIAKGNKESAGHFLKKRFGVEDERKIVSIGHNACPMNNHMSVLDSIANLPVSEKNKMHLILPMTYGGTDRYLDEVNEALRDSELKATVIDSFLPEEELAMLRLGSDVFIYATESDAFSGTVSQYLMAQCVVMCGSWLPYGARREAGLYYLEFHDPNDIGDQLVAVLDNYEEESELVKKNLTISNKFYSNEDMAAKWIWAYESALINHESS